MIALFDFIKLVFTRNPEWEKLSDMDKNRNFFMTNRYMAIKFPVQAHFLSHYRISTSAVMDYWHRSLSAQHSSVPSWIYAKTKKREDKEQKRYIPSEEVITWYCQRNEMSRRDFNTEVEYIGEIFLDEIKSLEKVLKSQGVI